MSIKTRRLCTKCRLDRCLKIGMKKEYVSKRKFNSDISNNDIFEIKMIKKQFLTTLNIYTSDNVGNYEFASLTNYEKHKLNEVCEYYKDLKEENTIRNVVEIHTREEWFRHEENLLKFLVGMVKKMSCFQPFPMEDKLIMIRNFFAVYINMRFIFSYDEENEAFLMAEINEQKICFKNSTWNNLISGDMEQIWKNCIAKHKTIMMNDPVIRDLLITLSMFREDAGIISSDLLRYKYLEINYLLERYLQVKLRYREKYEKHLKFIHYILSRMPEMYDGVQEFYQAVSPFHSSQLIKEIFQQKT